MDPSMGGVGEVRRVHVIYFLSRNGLIEQPHLIRVHHLHRSGVHLRDVKRWLSDLRGKDMPESFAWSYKRRYKAGCVWQDLTDDDLITPISDNEYVLKGSELPHNHNNPLFETFSTSDGSHIEEPEGNIEKAPELKLVQETLGVDQPDDSTSPTPPPRLDEELPGAAHTPRPPLWRQHEEEEEESEGEKKLLPDVEEQEEYSYSFEEKSTSTSSHASSRRAPSHVFWNLLGCKASTANDSVLRAGGRKDGGLPVSGNVSSRSLSHRRVVDGSSSSQRFSAMAPKLSSNSRRSRSRKMGERTISTVNKPVGKPNCSQCGKAFKPAKFYSHMKSCKGLKGSMREAEST